jgi:hypothetical protein
MAASLNDHEKPPQPSGHPAVWDLVLADIAERDRRGEAKYGTRLRPHNGRDALVDLYQELLDAVVYCRQAIYERDTQAARIAELEATVAKLAERLAACSEVLGRRAEKHPLEHPK